MFDLVRTTTKDNLYLHGLFSKGDKSKPAIIHIHGYGGDFYTNLFVKAIADKLAENNQAFLTVQNRGTGYETDFLTIDNKWRTIGSFYELLEESYLDIDAWIEYLHKQGYKNIILQGHSIGTMKIVRYLFEGNHTDLIKKLILLAPFDIIALQKASDEKWQEFVKVAEQKVREGKGKEIIPKEFLDIALSYQTYLSHHNPSDLTFMYKFHDKSYHFPVLKKIQIPVKMIVGTKDIYLHPSSSDYPEEAIEIMKKNIKDFSYKLIDNADHCYIGFENIVADEVNSFI